jgi:hypothetical protein
LCQSLNFSLEPQTTIETWVPGDSSESFPCLWAWTKFGGDNPGGRQLVAGSSSWVRRCCPAVSWLYLRLVFSGYCCKEGFLLCWQEQGKLQDQDRGWHAHCPFRECRHHNSAGKLSLGETPVQRPLLLECFKILLILCFPLNFKLLWRYILVDFKICLSHFTVSLTPLSCFKLVSHSPLFIFLPAGFQFPLELYLF